MTGIVNTPRVDVIDIPMIEDIQVEMRAIAIETSTIRKTGTGLGIVAEIELSILKMMIGNPTVEERSDLDPMADPTTKITSRRSEESREEKGRRTRGRERGGNAAAVLREMTMNRSGIVVIAQVMQQSLPQKQRRRHTESRWMGTVGEMEM
mmetsp:Transcript_30146/g.36593  ORF Transcript_30146/g.36593 Transcript_30146/m.36593 type:complete len:151 (+) Transcript_30146:248-700(+)